MKLKYVATVKTNFPEADFWITRRGSLKTVGTPTHDFYEEHIGIKVNRTDILLPEYLFYCMENLKNQEIWERYATGTLSLVNIRIEDVQSIEFVPR